ncbi:DUF4159 domain-containing protein [Gilvimarinus sp. F26214L]|uniref:DUF4159 domain-containing protein n=1 Tax=Gilvimarinus sp. DZF01 TaxID=3461371 RepID=UPI004045590F
MKFARGTLIRFAAGLVLAMFLGPAPAQAQFGGEPFIDREEYPEDDRPGDPEFTFVRGKYSNYGGQGAGPGRGWWETDFEDSDRNFLRGVRRYTNLDANSHGYKAVELTDPELFEHSFLYINMKRIPINVSGSGPNFSPEEAGALREFMLRGGFVMVDDFWGEQHWDDFLVELAKIFPDRDLTRLDIDHPLFHSFFDVKEILQVPGRSVTWNYNSGFYLDDPDFPPSVHAVLDDDGRVMMVANFNTDLGDGWEHTFYEPYPTRYVNEAYKLGINYIIYSLSH